MSKGSRRGRKKSNHRFDKFLLPECIVFAVLAMMCTIFVGLAYYGFWKKWIAPLASFAFAIPVALFVFVLEKFAPKRSDRFDAFVKRYRHIVIGVFGGLSLGMILAMVLYMMGCRLPHETSESGFGDSPAAVAEVGKNEMQEDWSGALTDIEGQDNTADDFYGSDKTEELGDGAGENASGADVDVKEPETTAVVSEQTDDEDIYLPAGDPRYLVEIIDPVLVAYHSERTGEDVAEWVALISDHMKMKINSDAQEDANTINRNRAFTDYTDRARKIEQDIDQNGMDTEALRTMIGLRENAFGIYPTKGLRLLLANDYHKLAITQNRDEDWGSAYSSYVQAISYEMLYVKMLRETDADYYYHLYNIGTLYQCLGDMATIDKEHRREAYFLSACFLEIVARSGVPGEKYAFMSNYYAGMANHKLYLMEKGNRSRKFNYYLSDAIHFYEASLGFENYQLQRDRQKGTLKNLYLNAQKYVKRYGQPDNMLSADEYARLASECG